VAAIVAVGTVLLLFFDAGYIRSASDRGSSQGNDRPRPRREVRGAGATGLQTIDISGDQTVEDVVDALLGKTALTVSNIRYSGAAIALGTFTGGEGIVGFESGIVLSTGDISFVVGPNNSSGAGWQNDQPGDPELDALIPGFETLDAAVLEFDFVCENVQRVGFEYVFSSEEYNEYVNASYNDVFGFFVNGKNVALLPDGITVVSINNVNGGNPLGENASNPQFYRNNVDDTCQFNETCPINTQMDGMTVVLIAETAINPGLNHIKIAIADAGDASLDSDVFIKGQSFICGSVNNSPPVCELDPAGPFTISSGAKLSFLVHGSDPDTGQTITMTDVGSFPPTATMSPILPLAGPATGISSQFSWQPVQTGTFIIRFQLSDSLGGFDTCTASINVVESILPFVVATTPVEGGLDHLWDDKVTVRFSEPVTGNLDASISAANQDGVAITVSAVLNDVFLSVSPKFEWPDDDVVTLRISASMTDLTGNALDGNLNGIPEGSPIDDFLLTFGTAPGVYPGDADDNGRVDERDVLPLGRFWELSGPARPRRTDGWNRELSEAWVPRGATHADCDGNGVIDSIDICTIAEHFGRSIPAMPSLGRPTEWTEPLHDDILGALARALLTCENIGDVARLALTSVLESENRPVASAPKSAALLENFPNPFNAGTVIRWELSTAAHVDIAIYDVLGRPVVSLFSADLPAGQHSVSWSGTGDQGQRLPSGVYITRLRTGSSVLSRAMVLLR